MKFAWGNPYFKCREDIHFVNASDAGEQPCICGAWTVIVENLTPRKKTGKTLQISGGYRPQ